ncbi:MAG: hypothetical protein WCZ43_06600 [Proteiniphilum sp.]
MSKKRDEYIDQLLSDLELLEKRLLSVKESDTLPFSFFSASFDRIERISRSLHELELMQIGEMKDQMERLVQFLSESDGRNNPAKEPEPSPEEEIGNNLPDSPSWKRAEATIEEKELPPMERIVLPEYRDPRMSEVAPSSLGTGQVAFPEKNGQEKQGSRSLNDIIQAPPTLLDLKRGISLNDRFLFQRELFNNSRSEMDRVVEALNKLGSFEEAENYLQSQQNWNFENQTVKEFLLIIKRGFE